MVYYVYTITGGLCCCFSCIEVLPERLKLRQKLLLVLYFALSMTVFYSVLGQAATYLVMAGGLAILTAFTKNRILCTALSLLGYLLSVTCNYLFLWLVSLALGMSAEELTQSTILLAVVSVVYCIICFVLTKLLGYYLNQKLKIASILKDSHLVSALFAEMLVLVVVFIFNISYGGHLGYSYGIMGFNAALFLLLFLVTAWLIYSMYQHLKEDQEIKRRVAQYDEFQRYIKKLEETNGMMRSFKHDYINILCTLSEYIENEDIQGLKHYFYDKIMPASHRFTETDTRLGMLSNVLPPGLKSLLSSKLVYSMECQIDTKIEIVAPIEETHMDTLDLSRILGIFLDNAIEAANECTKKEISFSMFYQEKDLYIIVKNTSTSPKQPLAELKRFGVSDKAEDRGIGLYNVAKILECYPNALWNMEYNEPYFTQQLILLHEENQ